jgi:hypothetical protein
MAEAYPTFLAGQRITAALLTSSQAVVARKTSDTSRSSTTTASDDPHLIFNVIANAVYVWDGFLKYDGGTTGDVSIAFSAPTGALGEWGGYGPGRNLISTSGAPGSLSSDVVTTNGYLVRMESNDVTQLRTYGAISGTQFIITPSGTLRVGSTSGTFALSWTQASADATSTTLYTDSWLRLHRIA